MNVTSLLTAAASLAAVLLLIVFAGRLARMTRLNRGTAATGRRLRVQESLSLDPRRRLLLVQCDHRTVLLLTGTQDQVVGWLPEPAP